LLAGSAGLGATIGALILASRRLRHQGIIFSLGAMGMEVALLCFALSPVYLLSLVLLFFAGILLSGFTTLQPIIALNAAPPGMQGRAIGAVAMAIGALPFGTWMLGQLAELVGAQAALAMVTTVGFIVLNIMRWRFPSLRL
jgi:predicted MFS family arabinose efflux permease